MPRIVYDDDLKIGARVASESSIGNLAAGIAHAVAEERERIAQIVESADNTMMNQGKLAAYIRKAR